MLAAIGLSQEVAMPIRVVAKGRVREGPSELLGDESWVVFVLDPYPDTEGARLAHACEVLCRGQVVASAAEGSVRWGDRVEVTGQLVLERVIGPLEDDLSAVRVWIKASDVTPIHDPHAF
jgi:hypothetical protein